MSPNKHLDGPGSVGSGDPPNGFPVEIRSHDFALTDAIREYAMEHLARRLAKHGHRIQTVIVRFGDANGAKGGADKLCRVEVLVPHQPPIVVEEIESDLRAAIDLCADRVEKAVQRDLERMRFEPRHRGGKLARDRKSIA